MPPRNDRAFALLTFAGLGDIALDELDIAPEARLARGRLPNYDFLPCLPRPDQLPRLARLRTVEDVFWLMGAPARVSDRRDLAALDAVVNAAALLRGLELRNRLFHPPKPGTPTFTCFVKQDHDRPVYRREVAAKVNARIAAAFPRWRNRDPASVEVWAFHIDEQVHLGFRLSDGRMRFRGRPPALREGALRPTVAAAMVRVAAPRAGETVLDPMCGAGTILAEGVACGSGAVFAGGDSDPAAVELAARRLAGAAVDIRRWDAADLPLGAATVDCVICNLPFGRRYSSRDANAALYPALIANWLGKLKPGGRMVLLTADGATLEKALRSRGLPWRVAARVKVMGLWASVYRAGASLQAGGAAAGECGALRAEQRVKRRRPEAGHSSGASSTSMPHSPASQSSSSALPWAVEGAAMLSSIARP